MPLYGDTAVKFQKQFTPTLIVWQFYSDTVVWPFWDCIIQADHRQPQGTFFLSLTLSFSHMVYLSVHLPLLTLLFHLGSLKPLEVILRDDLLYQKGVTQVQLCNSSPFELSHFLILTFCSNIFYSFLRAWYVTSCIKKIWRNITYLIDIINATINATIISIKYAWSPLWAALDIGVCLMF